MFDLDLEIRGWRAELARDEMLSSDEIIELESHLRDAVDELSVGVLSAEEAFLIAARRVGPPEELAMEFGKLNQPRIWIRRAQWMLGGYLLFSVLFGFVGNLGNFATLLAFRMHLAPPIAMVFSSVSVLLCLMSLSAWAWCITNGKSLGIDACASKFSSVARSGYRGWLVVGVFALFLVKIGFQMLTGVAIASVFTPSEFGMATLVSRIGGTVGQLLILASVIGLLCWLVRADCESKDRRWDSGKFFVLTCVMLLSVMGTYGLIGLSLPHLFGTF